MDVRRCCVAHFACALLLFYASSVLAVDRGYHLLFNTSSAVLHHHPCDFDRPIPSWVRGTLIKNGLGQFEMGKRKLKHIFDAFGKLSSWQFVGNQTVYFSTRFLQTKYYKDSLREGTVAPYLLFESAIPPFSWKENVIALMRGIDNPDANVFQVGAQDNRQYLAITDFWKSYEFDRDTLKTKYSVNPRVPGTMPWRNHLPIPLLSSAHPLKEFRTDNYINFVSVINPVYLSDVSLKLIRFKTALDREEIASVKVDKLPYMHSFALSTHYAVLFVSPIYIDTMKLVMHANPLNSLIWDRGANTQVYVVNIKTGKVISMETEPAFDMHHINAFEVSSKLILVDVVSYPNLDFLASLQKATMKKRTRRNLIPADCMLRRYVINVQRGTIEVQNFPYESNLNFINRLDMPCINEHFRQKPYCYIYGVVPKSDSINLSNATLVKKDVCRASNDLVWQTEDHYPSEPWFVANPHGRMEDDGILLSVILDGKRRKSYLGMWNATTMTLMSKSYLPAVVPFSIHGRFFEDELKKTNFQN